MKLFHMEKDGINKKKIDKVCIQGYFYECEILAIKTEDFTIGNNTYILLKSMLVQPVENRNMICIASMQKDLNNVPYLLATQIEIIEGEDMNYIFNVIRKLGFEGFLDY